ncbi:aspartate--ammonia ligase [Priestia taiwanensis]|uniref:Aspartate--ammonia ligase n=1 Tax=Priestia taiwanensis TaxID=1347902 RepID=A0A917ENF3_9BACI|nr:aspartate--ammonia ligase [Priestia taiwanensis]MBM7362987.1 aspartate--ammonia ligase [Priestia taiwanensis]GGE66719.1 aspartate--ammonia ligase [Priestia taiwanensis]
MYQTLLSIKETQVAIKEVKTKVEEQLANRLALLRVSAPLFVTKKSGLNDHLNGVERPISFDILHSGEELEVIHSLAKWKRSALYEYGFSIGEGLYTNMNAIRRDEELDETHSIYVDQWDWEKVIAPEWRTIDYLQETVRTIYSIFKELEDHLYTRYPFFGKYLPDDIIFITAQELENKYPELTPKEREDAIVKEHGAVFVIGIGDALASGEKHDGRAADYDDWHLNGDILVWHPTLQSAFELSSMGIRVDAKSLDEQLTKSAEDFKRDYDFHRGILENTLPLTIGGGIGQSRTCMFFLRKAHIGEVQSSVWPDDVRNKCKEKNIHLL